MTEQEHRAAVIAEAMTWISTPYHHSAKVKGAGADCMTFIVAVAEATGLLKGYQPPKYGPQYGANRDDETYMRGIKEYCREVETPQPGDIVMWKAGRVYSHAAIVVDWPQIIHAHAANGVVLDDTSVSSWFSGKPHKFFSAW